MYHISDIKHAVEKQVPLFGNGDEIDLDALDYLKDPKKVSSKDKRMLFGKFRKEDKPFLWIVWNCATCGAQQRTARPKTFFLNRDGRLGLGDADSCGWSPDERKKVDFYIRLTDNSGQDNAPDCPDCIRKKAVRLDSVLEAFYSDPLEWVNTHDAREDCWQWDEVKAVHVYPAGYGDRPEGWKYCKVDVFVRGHLLSRRVQDYRTFVEYDYSKWEALREKTIISRNVTDTQKMLKSIGLEAGVCGRDSDPHSRAVDLADKFLTGLVKGVDLYDLAGYIEKEARKIRTDMERNGQMGHIMNSGRRMNFGKYKGLPVHHVIDFDRDYIHWALNKVDSFALNEEEQAHYDGKPWKARTGRSKPLDNKEFLESLHPEECTEGMPVRQADVPDTPSAGNGTDGMPQPVFPDTPPFACDDLPF